MKLGIIGAMDIEVAMLKERMTEKTTEQRGSMTFFLGRLEGLEVVVAQCGVGKVHAAMCAQTMCDRYAVTHLVNTGIAGSLDPRLDIADVVISEDAMYHDMDATHFGYPMGRVPGLSVTAFPADEGLKKLAFAASEELKPGHTRYGRVASGDLFVSEDGAKSRITQRTGASCTEMEGAAIAQAAYCNGVPFVIIRAISDKADHSAEMDYPSFEKLAAAHCAQVTCTLARKLAEQD